MKAERFSARSRRLWLGVALCVAGVMVAPQQAHAQRGAAPKAAEPKAPASLADSLTGADLDEYRIALALARDGDFVNAYDRFNAVYKRTGDPRLLWNMASSLRRTRRYAAVTQLVRQYITEAEPRGLITPDEKASAEQLLETMDTLTARIKVSVNVEGANILLDGESIGISPLSEPVLTDVGRRKLSVTKAGYQPYSAELVVDPRSNDEVKVELVEVVREGKLIIRVDVPSAQILLNEQVMGTGQWTGMTQAGPQLLRVRADGYREYSNDFVLSENGVRAFDVSMVANKKPVPAWVWIGGAVLLAGGLATAGAFIFKGDTVAECSRPAGNPLCAGGTFGSLPLFDVK